MRTKKQRQTLKRNFLLFMLGGIRGQLNHIKSSFEKNDETKQVLFLTQIVINYTDNLRSYIKNGKNLTNHIKD